MRGRARSASVSIGAGDGVLRRRGPRRSCRPARGHRRRRSAARQRGWRGCGRGRGRARPGRVRRGGARARRQVGAGEHLWLASSRPSTSSTSRRARRSPAVSEREPQLPGAGVVRSRCSTRRSTGQPSASSSALPAGQQFVDAGVTFHACGSLGRRRRGPGSRVAGRARYSAISSDRFENSSHTASGIPTMRQCRRCPDGPWIRLRCRTPTRRPARRSASRPTIVAASTVSRSAASPRP